MAGWVAMLWCVWTWWLPGWEEPSYFLLLRTEDKCSWGGGVQVWFEYEDFAQVTCQERYIYCAQWRMSESISCLSWKKSWSNRCFFRDTFLTFFVISQFFRNSICRGSSDSDLCNLRLVYSGQEMENTWTVLPLLLGALQ